MSNTIEKKGLPNEFTSGEVGDIYVDTDTGYKFKCVCKSKLNYHVGSVYYHTWLPIKENYKQIMEDIKNAKY